MHFQLKGRFASMLQASGLYLEGSAFSSLNVRCLCRFRLSPVHRHLLFQI